MAEPSITQVLTVLREDLADMLERVHPQMSAELAAVYEHRIACYRSAIRWIETHGPNEVIQTSAATIMPQPR
jgi:hypothetical protein